MHVVSCWTLYQNQNEKEQILDRQIQFMHSSKKQTCGNLQGGAWWFWNENLNKIFNIHTMKASLICVGAEAHGDVTRWHMHRAYGTWKLPGVFLLVYKGRISVQQRLHTVLIFAKTIVPCVHNSVDTSHSKRLVFLQDTFGPRVISHYYAARHGCG